MTTIEIQGRTVEEATHAAATQLGVPPASLRVTVLEETKGLFGRTQVRIRAEAALEPPAPAPAALAPAEPAPAPPAPKRPARASKAKPAPVPAPEEPPGPEPGPGHGPGHGPEPGSEAEAASPDPLEGQEEDVEAEAAPEVEATEEDAAEVLGVVRDILSKAELEAQADVISRNGRYVNIEITGRDAAHLVGKNGEVLNSLQYLVNLILSRHMERPVRATIDGNHYRQRREDALRTQALDIAAEVRGRGEEAVLPPLPAFERRIVHHALQSMEGVTTYSEGEEPNRRVVIAPVE
jgi:spoIIIJ-associated protein